MARLNASDSDAVKIEKLKVELATHRINERHRTIRSLGLALMAVIALAIIAWASVTILNKPAWLELMLALIAAMTGPMGLLLWKIRHANRLADRYRRRYEELSRRPDREEPPPGRGLP